MINPPIRKAMILCAGLGTRMLPITETVPKPIIPVLNIPNVNHTINLLRRAGIKEFIINLFHLGGQIKKHLGDGAALGVKIFYSNENVLLGTGGGIKKVRGFFDGGTFIVANCDFVADFDLENALRAHRIRRSLATMILLIQQRLQNRYSKVGVDKYGALCKLSNFTTRKPIKHGFFSGIHILEPEIFEYLKNTPSSIIDTAYKSLMKAEPNRVHGEFVDGTWYETGELYTLWESSMDALKKLSTTSFPKLLHSNRYREIQTGVWLNRQTRLPASIKIVPPIVIGSACSFGDGCRLGPFTVIGDHSIVGMGTRIERAILLPRSHTVAGNKISRAVVYTDKILPIRTYSRKSPRH